jgi:hypothetical protein
MTAYTACIFAIARIGVDAPCGFAFLSSFSVLVLVTAYRSLTACSARILAVTRGRIGASGIVALLPIRSICITIPTRWRTAATKTIVAIVIAVAQCCIDTTQVVTRLVVHAPGRSECAVYIAIAT